MAKRQAVQPAVADLLRLDVQHVLRYQIDWAGDRCFAVLKVAGCKIFAGAQSYISMSGLFSKVREAEGARTNLQSFRYSVAEVLLAKQPGVQRFRRVVEQSGFGIAQ